MPKQQVVSSDKMGVGKKKGGKNWTTAEVEARQKATEKLTRESPIVFYKPKYLSEEAAKIWDFHIKYSRDLALLDKLDQEILGLYCDFLARYRLEIEKSEPDDKNLQAWARVIKNYANDLGFTPAARARLAKKMADEELNKDPFDKMFG